MPIKPENRHRYPPNWREIRAAILDRAGDRCEHEGCGARNGALGYWGRGADGKPRFWHSFGCEDQKHIRIVLTIAHLDHQPENNDPANLRAMCQRHHLEYDREHHKREAAKTRRAKMRTLEMFDAD